MWRSMLPAPRFQHLAMLSKLAFGPLLQSCFHPSDIAGLTVGALVLCQVCLLHHYFFPH